MADPSTSTHVRRRSSIAYDPARDTFTEIPGTVTENAVSEDRGDSDPNSRHDSASPVRSRKRKLSDTADTEIREGRSFEKVPSSGPTNGAEHNGHTAQNTKPINSVSDLPRIPRVAREDGEVRPRPRRSPPAANSRRTDEQTDSYRPRNGDRPRQRERERERPRRRSRSPTSRVPDAYRRRSPPQARERPRSPSPIRASPPREQIRPGGARGRGRNLLAEQERLAAERERQRQGLNNGHNNNTNNRQGLVPQGVQDVSNQFYNNRPEWVRERGRDWRQNDSKIKGLRKFNNWIKSCLIQRFSPEEKSIGQEEELGWGEVAKEPEEKKPLFVLDVGCGKGGDLGKWQLAPQTVGLYVGLDPADISISQANDRFREMRKGRRPIFDARFAVKDCYGEWIGDIPIVQEVGIDPAAGSGQINRWGGGGGFDVVTMMFSMHYAFESEEKVKMMLRNVAGSLKKGGRFLGVVPNSDVLAERIRKWYAERPQEAKDAVDRQKKLANPVDSDVTAPKDGEATESAPPTTDGKEEDPNLASTPTVSPKDESPSWGNSIYNVRFPAPTIQPLDPSGVFRPPFGWKYTYWMDEAVDVPEFVVPWEAFRAIAVKFGLEQRYRRGFLDIWNTETDLERPTVDLAMAKELRALGARMGVVRPGGGPMVLSDEEKEAVAFYHGFCFVKV